MWFLTLLTWAAFLVQICFITLSVAAGLYYLAELVEEYTTATGRVIKYGILVTSGIYVGLLLFEDLPFSLIVCGLASNGLYFVVLKTFPFIEFTSPTFLASIVLIIVNHYLTFSHFSTVWHPFSEILAFFTICLWLVPFAFFVSLSANENVLPTVSGIADNSENTDGDVVTNYFKKQSSKMGLLTLLKSAQDSLLPTRGKKSY